MNNGLITDHLTPSAPAAPAVASPMPGVTRLPESIIVRNLAGHPLGAETVLQVRRAAIQRGSGWRETVKTWWRRMKGRSELAALDDRMLKDIGITRNEARREARKWFWLE